MTILRAALVSAACALGSCAVGPDYHGPPPSEYTEPVTFKNAAESGNWKVGEPADHVERGEWWKIFRDPKLDELVRQALANNQDLRVAEARIAEARAMDRSTAAQFYPSLDFQGTGVRERSTNTGAIQKGEILGGGTAAPVGGAAASTASSITLTQPRAYNYNLFQAPLALSWELDLFGRIRRSYESSRAQREATEADFQNMALSVAANVATNYFSLRSLDAEAEVLDRTIATRKEGLRVYNERFKAGLTSELDVSRAETDLAKSEAELYSVLRTRGQVENTIATLLGQPASTLRLVRRPQTDAQPPKIPVGLPARLLERRPDVASAERTLASANAEIGVATAAFFPSIKLTGMGGFESADISQLFNWESRAWQIGPSISLPIFEGGKNIAELGLQRARYDEQVGTYRGKVLTAFQEVETALSDQRQLAGQLAAEERAVNSAQRSLVLARAQYDKGSTTFLDVLDSERTALSEERTRAQLIGQRQQTAVQLIKALGGGWE